jgi:hypothetical protein
MTNIHRHYISRLFRQLIEKYKLYSSVYKLYSSVITNKYLVVSCSVRTAAELGTPVHLFHFSVSIKVK